MASSEPATDTKMASSPTDDQSLKLAVAISLLRSKLLRKQPPPPPRPSNPPSETDALRWKRKAERAKTRTSSTERRSQGKPKILHKRRKRINNSNIKRFSDIYSKNEAEQLRAAVDFLLELCDTTSPGRVEEANFANWSHQAADFILASLRNLLSIGNNMELIEGIVSSLIVRLVKRMCSPSHGDESRQTDTDTQFYIQHLIRKLGCEPHIGQRAILSVSQRISMVAENLLFLDPFDEAFSNMHECLFIMVQLIEFSDIRLLVNLVEG
ncbi:hypothetical protein OIU84_010469 [Salix udensis]|uniref:Uncharacterized protein n=1 Tax=Salix udensis TaxID=889485 RepID=A0AAD6NW51_9ROSI|nr:hypothetical protein OIU84_010469 [Salix udensis]